MIKDEDGRTCKVCNQYKTYDNFYKMDFGYRGVCKPCLLATAKVRRDERKIKQAKKYLEPRPAPPVFPVHVSSEAKPYWMDDSVVDLNPHIKSTKFSS